MYKQDPESFKEFLHFLYSIKTNKFSDSLFTIEFHDHISEKPTLEKEPLKEFGVFEYPEYYKTIMSDFEKISSLNKEEKDG